MRAIRVLSVVLAGLLLWACGTPISDKSKAGDNSVEQKAMKQAGSDE